MPWSNGLETEEQKVPHDVLVVIVEPIEAGHHVGDLKLLLGVLQQGDKGSLGALRQLVGSDADVKSLLPQHGLPLVGGPAEACGGEADVGGPVCTALILCRSWSCILVLVDFLSMDRKVRGISSVPRASALWELPTCAGNIKPAGEARRPHSCWRWS